MSEELVDMTAVHKAREDGWEIGFFQDGRPEGMVVQRADGNAQTLDGQQVRFDDELRLGVYKMCEDPFEELEEQRHGTKIELRLR